MEYPSLFRTDWDVLAAIVVLSFFIERALPLLFEHRFFVKRLAQQGLRTSA